MQKRVNILLLFSLVVLSALVSTDVHAQETPAPEKKEAPAAEGAAPAKGAGEIKTVGPISPGSGAGAGEREESKKAPKVVTPEEQALIHLTNGDELKRAKNFEESVAEYDLALEKDETLVPAYLGRASARFLLMDFETALADYNSAIEKTEALMKKYKTQAKIKKVLEDYRGAQVDLAKIEALRPQMAEAFYQRGYLKHFLEDTEGGCEDVAKSVEYGYLKANDFQQENCQ